MPALSWVAVALVGGVAAWIGTREMRRIKAKRFVGRRPLGGAEFYDVFYKDSQLDPKQVVAVRDAVARALEVPAGLLRPEDSFEQELAPAEGWERGWDDGLPVIRAMGLMVEGARRQVDWRTINKLDDLIKQIARAS